MTISYEYIIFFLATIIVSFFIHRFFFKQTYTHILKKANISGDRWSSQTKPVTGGITFYAVFLMSSIIYYLFYNGNIGYNSHIIGISLIITISFFMGLADDIISTSPYFKLFVQILSGIILINFGIVIDFSVNIYINYGLTLIWVIGIMNSINMLDNIDAVTSLVSIAIITGIIVNMILNNNIEDAFIFYILIGTMAALVSFLIFNWYPSKMYMGDNGSQFLGALLASIGIIFIWNKTEVITSHNETKQVISVLLAFLVPVIDTVTVIINRILSKKSPFVGGRDHTTHYLSYRGIPEKKIALIFFMLSLISVGFSVYIINFVDNWSFIHILLFGSFILMTFLVLYINTRITKPN